jgi:hypothetical protein
LDINNQYDYATSVNCSLTPYVIGNWYHIVGTYDGSKIRFYLNGIAVDSSSYTGQMTDSGQNLFFGKYGNSNNYLPGSISEIRIYNRALSPAEITTLYNQ